MNQRFKSTLIDKLLDNSIEMGELKFLREDIDAADLSCIIQRIYDLNESYILKISAVNGMLEKLNVIKNKRRNNRFFNKIRTGFRQVSKSDKKIILAEGDSWFNYPIILTDLVDVIGMDKDLAVYSIASGGDWLLNMLTARVYVEELSLLHPDYFLISGGGNDLVGSSRIAAMLDPTGQSNEYARNEWAQYIIGKVHSAGIQLNKADFDDGLKYISKDFFALLMFFHLQYYFLINEILNAGDKSNKTPKFENIKIITQGYDYPIPSYGSGVGVNPLHWYVPLIRKFQQNGNWLKTPMQLRGINDAETQRKIVYAMIFLFNEMMIDIGHIFTDDKKMPGRVFHIDARESVGDSGWTDELHPKAENFMKIGRVFKQCIKDPASATYQQVFVVKEFNK